MPDESIRQSVRVQAPPPAVFRALTDAAELRRWFPTQAETDPRPGGRYQFAWEFAQAAQNGTQQGEYLEVVPDEKVSYTWSLEPPHADTRVDFHLRSEDGATLVDLEHSGWPAGEQGEQQRAKHAGPWQFYMSNLKSYLESGQDARAAVLGQKTGEPKTA